MERKLVRWYRRYVGWSDYILKLIFPGPTRANVTTAVVMVLGGTLSVTYVYFNSPNIDPPTLAQIRDISLIVGGVIALLFAGWRGLMAERQTELSERRLLDERYQRAAEMLGSPVIAVRLAGIYALDRLLVDDLRRYYTEVMRLFVAFVRNPTEDPNTDSIDSLRDDVQAALDGIGRRHDPGGLGRLPESAWKSDADLLHEYVIVELQGVVLRNARLISGKFQKVYFMGSDLSELRSIDTNFSEARFTQATIVDAKLFEANFSRADFFGANLSGSKFAKSNLCGMNLKDANLSGVDFSGGDEPPVSGLTQDQLDQAKADPNNPPKLEGLLDAVTGEPLVWRGGPPIQRTVD